MDPQPLYGSWGFSRPAKANCFKVIFVLYRVTAITKLSASIDEMQKICIDLIAIRTYNIRNTNTKLSA